MTLGEAILGVAVLLEERTFGFKGMFNTCCLTEKDKVYIGMKNECKEVRRNEKGQQAIVPK